jgi:hypothetical protein
MTARDYKTTLQAIRKAASVFRKDRKKARKFLYDIGLLDRAGRPVKPCVTSAKS